MKMRGLIVALVVLAGLGGVLYWSNHRKPAAAVESSADNPKLLTLKEADLVRLELKKKDTDAVVLARGDSGKWQITAPKPYPANQEVAGAVTSALASLNAERVVEDKAGDLSQYGLSPAALEVDVAGKNGQPHKLLVGDETPTGNAFFARLDDGPRIVTISGYNKGLIDKTLTDLRDKRLLTVDPAKVSRVELTARKQNIEFGRSQDSWQILKPRPLRADNGKVTDLVNKVTDAKMDISGAPDEDKKAAAAFAAGAPVGAIRLTAESGAQELQIRKNKDDYYANSSAVEGVYRVFSDVGQALDKGLDDFRNKNLFDFGYNQAGKLEMHDGSKSYLLARNGDDWSSDGKKMDASNVEALVEKVRTLEADKFVDSGFAKPVIDLAVTSADGKHTEKVLISKAGNNYIAKRDNEPALYQLDAATIEGLEKAAADLVPAPETKPADAKASAPPSPAAK